MRRSALLPALLLLGACDTAVLDLGGDRAASGSGGDDGDDGGAGGPPVQVGMSENQLAAGGNSTCFRREDGVVKCWGQNDKGQLAIETVSQCGALDCTSVPFTAPALEGSRQIALGARFGCARLGGGDEDAQPVSCWGDNSLGQLGRGTSDQDVHLEPLAVGLDDAVELAVGAHHACAISSARAVHCWGLAEDGQLGVDPATLARCPVPDELRGSAGLPDADDAACAREPIEVPALQGAVALALGDAHTCAALEDGRLLCTGSNGAGQLGSGDAASFEPLEVLAGDVSVIGAGAKHSCAVQGARTRCWGSDTLGQLGVGSVEHQTCDDEPCLLAPAPLPDLPAVRELRLGGSFSCALMSDGKARCWGDDSSGQLGNSSFDEDTCETSTGESFDCLKRPLQEVYDLSDVLELRAGTRHACALLGTGEVRCWGSAEAAQTSTHQDATFPSTVYGLD